MKEKTFRRISFRETTPGRENYFPDSGRSKTNFGSRTIFFYLILALGCFILLAKLAQLQIIFGAQNRLVADGNRIRKMIDRAPRGIIYDANKQPLVRNVPIYRLKVKDKTDEFVSISREDALKIEAKGGEEAERLRVDVGRSYPYAAPLVHVLGFLGEASQKEVASGKYGIGDLLGRSGIEEQYEGALRGIDGGEVYEVNTQGEKIRTLGRSAPISGEDLYLSIDADLSKVAYDALGGQKGAIVAMIPKTGEIMVLVSSPSFDPGNITEKVLTDQDKPFFNRAIGGVYPPGSIYKILVSTAGLEEEKLKADTYFDDAGFIQVGIYRYNNWYYTQYGRTEGQVNVVKALKRSTDTFFYKAGEWIGARKLIEWSEKFGLGKTTGVDLPGEVAGLLPDIENEWYLGNTYHLAIGQGDLLLTPLQANSIAGVIASDGLLCQPTTFIKTASTQGLPPRCRDLKIKSSTINIVKEGMREACSTGGTAYPFFDFSPQVGCKTGTAEYGDPDDKTHAWFTAFAPLDDPQIVVTAVVEGGGEGSSVAAPMVKKVLEGFFH